MSTIKIYIDDRLLCRADVASSVGWLELSRHISKCIDRLASIRETVENEEAIAMQRDNDWTAFIEAVGNLASVEPSRILSKDRHRPLPLLRAIVAASWMQATGENLNRCTLRMGMDHSSVIARLAKLDDDGRIYPEVRELHMAADRICHEILTPKP